MKDEMTRPIYENPETLKAERDFADSLEAKYKCKFLKLPKVYRIDFMIFRGEHYAGCAEIKCRNMPSDRHDTLILSLSKWESLRRWSKYGKSTLFIRFTDCDKFYKYECQTLDIKLDGRPITDRNDKEDKEPCVHIPICDMTEIVYEGAIA